MTTLQELSKRLSIRAAGLSVTLVLYVAFFALTHQVAKSAYGSVAFLLPLVVAAWFWGWKGGALASAGGMLLNVLVLFLMRDTEGLLSVTLQGAVFYSIVGVGVGYLRDTNRKLREAREEIRTLSGLLPICMHCKSIRDDTGNWHDLGTYLKQRTGQDLTHGLCPECKQKYYATVNFGNTHP